MFTGITEELGALAQIEKPTSSSSQTWRFHFYAPITSLTAQIGESLSVNGCCLTCVTCASPFWSADLMPETLERTLFGTLPLQAPVNIERALPIHGRFGGHIVQGHIDGIAIIDRIENNLFHITPPALLLRYIAEKGSIALDGVSLTVASTDGTGCWVALIPHTLSHTTFGIKKAGDLVHVEVDILAKYVERILH